ncbi:MULTISPECIES: hypothetical protein [Emticicia]|uniref:hypothetical protein n=1 Tax=Emticicia TaxID=312278 RepID=UPI0007D8AEC9|nr:MULTISPECIES: hypothetical protein [Emticicia]
MEEKQFDELIRSKYLDDEDEPVWDTTKVWQTIKPTKQYQFSYFKYAASIAILIGFGALYLVFYKNEKTKIISILLPKTKIKSVNKPIHSKPNNEIQKSNTHANLYTKTQKPKLFIEENTKSTATESTQEGTTNTFSEPKLEVSLQQETLTERTIPTTENIPTNHVIVLNIPIEEDLKPQRKKRIIGRFFQQIERYSNGEKFEWEEVNIRPKKIWAYFKNSFVADSTTIY